MRRGTSTLLREVDWIVEDDQRWIVMGPNGAGKTTLMMLASGRMFPTTGDVQLRGATMGAGDNADLRPRRGWASISGMANRYRRSQRARCTKKRGSRCSRGSRASGA